MLIRIMIQMTYPIDKLLNQTIPLLFLVYVTKLAIWDELYAIFKTNNPCYFVEQIYTKPFKTVIPFSDDISFLVFPQNDVGLLLENHQ